MDEVIKLVALHLKIVGWKCGKLEEIEEFNHAIQTLEKLAFKIDYYTLIYKTELVPNNICSVDEFYGIQQQPFDNIRNLISNNDTTENETNTITVDLPNDPQVDQLLNELEEESFLVPSQTQVPSQTIYSMARQLTHVIGVSVSTDDMKRLKCIFERTVRFMKVADIRKFFVYYMAMTPIYNYAHIHDKKICIMNNPQVFSTHVNEFLKLFGVEVKFPHSWILNIYNFHDRQEIDGLSHMVILTYNLCSLTNFFFSRDYNKSMKFVRLNVSHQQQLKNMMKIHQRKENMQKE